MPTTPAAEGVSGRYAHGSPLPLNFEPNLGQLGAGDAEFVAHGKGYGIALTKQGAVLALGADVVRLRLAGVREGIEPQAEAPLPGRINYYIGNDPSKWRENVATFGRIRYPQVYPGVDLVYYGTEGRLEYDFELAPGAKVKPVHLAFDGGERVSLDRRGNLHVTAQGHDVIFDRPVAYQMDGQERHSVAARYRVQGQTVGFELGAYDPRKALIIDPVLNYFSYVGGSGTDVLGTTSPQVNGISGQAAAIDGSNNLYVVGYTSSANFPTQSAFASPPAKTYGSLWGFVTKFAPDAKSVVFSTYLGGSNGNDFGYGIAVDSQGNAFVTGTTGSNDFPITAGAYQTVCSPNFVNNGHIAQSSCANGNSQSAFVTKLSPTGALLASTFLGSTYGSYGRAVAVDAAGRPYVVGYAPPGENIPNPPPGGFNPAVGFPTTAGAVVTAYNYSSSEPVNGTLQFDAFVSVFNPTLTTLVYSTLIGDDRPFSAIIANGSQADAIGTAVAVDASGNFYLAGYTNDAYLPTTAGAYEPNALSCGNELPGTTQLGGNCGFVSKFSPVTNANGASLIYATYLGGQATAAAAGHASWSDYVSGVTADASGNVYVVGLANEAGFPTTAGAYQTTCDGYDNVTSTGDYYCSAAFIAKLDHTGATLLASTYFGCITCSGDAVYGVGPVRLDAAGNVYVTGIGGNSLPLVNGFPSNNGGGASPFVAEFDSALSTLKFSTMLNVGGGGQLSSAGLALDSSGAIYLAGNVNSPASSAATSGAFQASYGGGSADGFVAKISLPPIVYDPGSSILTIASVGVGAATYVNVALKNIGNYVFVLQTATAQAVASPAATYDPATGILALPSVQVAGTTYINVTLKNTGNYTFVLLSATAQP